MLHNLMPLANTQLIHMLTPQEYEAMLDVLQLGGLQKVTARLIDGLDITHTQEGRFEVAFVTVVPFFRWGRGGVGWS